MRLWGFSRINSHKSQVRCTDVLPLKSITLPTVILPTGQFFFVFFLIFYRANISLIDSYFGISLLEKVWHPLFYVHARWHKKVLLQGNLLCDTTKQPEHCDTELKSVLPPLKWDWFIRNVPRELWCLGAMLANRILFCLKQRLGWFCWLECSRFSSSFSETWLHLSAVFMLRFLKALLRIKELPSMLLFYVVPPPWLDRENQITRLFLFHDAKIAPFLPWTELKLRLYLKD